MDEESLKTSTLYAIHKHIAVKCKSSQEAWLACKREHADPKHCLSAGKDILNCVNSLCDFCLPAQPCTAERSATTNVLQRASALCNYAFGVSSGCSLSPTAVALGCRGPRLRATAATLQGCLRINVPASAQPMANDCRT